MSTPENGHTKNANDAAAPSLDRGGREVRASGSQLPAAPPSPLADGQVLRSTAKVQPGLTCPCACCVEGINRQLHGRVLDWNCSCGDYDTEERCDCAYCIAFMEGTT